MRLVQQFIMAAFAAFTLNAGTGCLVNEAYVADRAPPARHIVVVEPRPGYVWIDPRWAFIGDEWVLQPGYWVRERPDHVYVQGVWVVREQRYHWHDGHFRHRHRPAPVHRPRHRR